MSAIAHTLPASIGWSPISHFTRNQAIKELQLLRGGTRTRRVGRRAARAYRIAPKITTASELDEFRVFVQNVHAEGGILWVPEEESRTHVNVLCSPLADGSKTTFSLGVMAPSDVTVFVDGVPQSSGYTIHQAANLLSDDVATCSDAITDFYDFGNWDIAQESRFGRQGASCVKVTPAGTGTPYLYPTTANAAAVVQGELYAVMTSIFEQRSTARDYQLGIRYYDSGLTYLTHTWEPTVSSAPGEWQDRHYSTVLSTANTAYITPIVYCHDTVNTDPFYGDCLAVIPGDYDTWHLPSQAPGVVEFDTAPSAGSVVTCIATGVRVTRCAMQPGRQWDLEVGGNSRISSFDVVESPEV